jgi:cyclopropane-fatty-acyl-phospholipid synthase
MNAGERLAKRTVLTLLGRMNRERLVLHDGATTHTFGADAPPGTPTLAPEVTIHDARAWTAIATGGSAGLGRAFFEGWWDSDDPTAVVRVLIRNLAGLDRWRDRVGAPVRALADPVRAVARRMDP